MRKKLGLVVLAALILVAALLLWRWRGTRGGEAAGPGVAAVEDPVARRVAARKGGEVPAAPAGLRGRVVDEHGAAVAGALVSVSRRSFDGGAALRSGETGEPLTATSGADGGFEVVGLLAGRYSLAATAAKRLPTVFEPVHLRAGEIAEGIELVLRGGGQALSGTVSDIGGGPVEGAVVRASRLNAFSVEVFFRAPLSTKTDAEGHYELTLANGVYGVEVVHGDYESADDSVELAGAPRTLDFRLTPGAVIEGTVIARDSGRPVADALVTIAQEEVPVIGVGLGGAARTDAEGKFILRGLSSGVIALHALARGYVSGAPTEVELGIAERVTDVVIEVDGAFTVSGFVVDKRDRGQAIADVIVGAYNFSPGIAHVADQPSAADGYFEIFGVRPGTYTMGGAGDERLPTLFGETITVVDRDLEAIVLELDAGVSIRGRVEPAAVGQLSLELDSEDFGIGNMLQLASSVLVHGTSAEDGSFELRGVGTGTFTVVAKIEDGREGRTEVVVADSDLEGVVVTLQARATLTGVVVDESGRPVEGVNVEVEPDKEQGIMSMVGSSMFGGGAPTGPDGRFEQRGLGDGRHRVKVSDDTGQLAWADAEAKRKDAERYRPKFVEIEGTTTPPELRLVVEKRGEELRGRVLGPGGAPVADAWVTAQFVPPEAMASPFGFDGAQGDGDGGGDAEGERKGSITITVGAGSASGKVEDPTLQGGGDGGGEGGDAANSSAQVSRWNPKEKPVLTDAEGRFVVRGLRKGSYNLEAEGLKGSARGRLEKVATGTTVTLRLGGLATLRGVVTRGGKPVGSYVVETSGASDRRTTVFGTDGAYALRRLDPGKYGVSVTSTEGRGAGEILVKAGETKTLDIALVGYGSVRGMVVDAVSGEPFAHKQVFAMSDEGMDPGQIAAAMMKGDGPRTDADGRFEVGGLGAGRGTLMVTADENFGGEFIAFSEFNLEAGQALDLGVLKGHEQKKVDKDKRGELGFLITRATWSERPGRKEGEGEAPPAGLSADIDYVWVIEVEQAGPAQAAGLLVGDRVTTIDGVPTEAIGALVAYQMLSASRITVGQTVVLGIERAGSAKSISITAAAAAPGAGAPTP